MKKKLYADVVQWVRREQETNFWNIEILFRNNRNLDYC